MAPLTGQGRYFDGLSARPVPVSLRLAGGRLEVLGPGLRRDWDCLDLRAAETPPPLMLVGPAGATERVEFADEALAEAVAALASDLHARSQARGTPRLLVGAAAAGAALLLVAILGMPLVADVLAPLVPPAVERRLGESVEGRVVALLGTPPVCDEPAGRAALERMIAALVRARASAGAPPAGLRVSVRRSATANALILPGARVIVLSGLIAQAREPAELAAVLAHELGHVAARDTTRSLIRASGTSLLLSFLLGDLTGSTLVVALGDAVLAAGHGRKAERAADAYAVETMARAGADGAALAAILERLDSGEDGAALLRSHPFTRERAATIRAQTAGAPNGAPILDEGDWRALRAICPPAGAAP